MDKRSFSASLSFANRTVCFLSLLCDIEFLNLELCFDTESINLCPIFGKKKIAEHFQKYSISFLTLLFQANGLTNQDALRGQCYSQQSGYYILVIVNINPSRAIGCHLDSSCVQQ